MKTQLLSYIVCTNCQGTLTELGSGSAENDEITEGLLECQECGRQYPIRRGIPRFPSATGKNGEETTQKTQQVYNFTWNHFGSSEITFDWKKDSYNYIQKIPVSLIKGPGKVGLEAGCGSGADLLRLSSAGSTIIAFDLSEGVETAYEATKHLDNVFIVQGDIHNLPFRTKTFDYIYSFGVLHHLPKPEEGFKQLGPLLKTDSPLITYLYESFDDRSVCERSLLNMATSIRRVTTRIPPRILDFLCCLFVPFVWLMCSLPAQAVRHFSIGLFEKIPFRHTLKWATLRSDLFDRLAPPVEHRFSERQVRQLYKNTGLERVEVRHHRGWVSWGFSAKALEARHHICS